MNKDEIFSQFVLDRNKESLTEAEIKMLDKLSLSEVKECLDQASKQKYYNQSLDLGRKLALVCIYGAFGNNHFVISTKEIAGAITAMGRDTIKYMDQINELYWYEYWHEDLELHEHLGVDSSKVKKIDPTWIHRETLSVYDGEPTQEEIDEGVYQRKFPVSVYIDTDSLFVNFSLGMKSCDFQGDEKAKQDFVLKVSKFRLEPLFKKKLDSYAKKYGVDNIQDFELENINEAILFVSKKKYIKHTVWEDGTVFPRKQQIVSKGVNLVQRGTPKFAKEKIMQIIHYLFDHSETYNIRDLLKFIRDLKKEFELQNVDDICPSSNLNMYISNKVMDDGVLIDGPGIVDDKKDLVFGKRTYFTVKAAGLYNYMLHNNPEWMNDYEIIKPGTKIKVYPCVHDKNDKFAYPIGVFPKEFAPPIDYDELFEKTILDGVNYYIEALNLPKLNKRLKVVMSLF
jgi:hypothetical protein